ncbi:MAG: sensor histidine kinase, partial [Byssovorax sp.]
LHKTEVRRLKMNVQILKNDLPAALGEALAALEAYDIHLPPYPDDSTLTAEFDRTMAMIGDRPIASLVALPALNDPEIAALQDVLQEMFSPTYQLSTNNFGITVMKVLQSSLTHGISRSSIYACVNFGTILCSRLDVERGLEFGRAALLLNEIYPDKKSEAMLWNMWGAFVQHWTESYTTYRASLRRAIHAGLETGQYIWSFYSTCNTMVSSLMMGRHLNDIVEEAKLYMPLCRLDKFNAITWMVGAAADLCEDLRTPDEGDGKARTPWVDMNAVAEEARRINNQGSLYFMNVFAVIGGIFRGSYEEVAEIWDRTDPETLGMLAAFHLSPCYCFYGALAFSRASGTVAPELGETYVARLRECARKVERWAELGPQSFRHRSLILKAELARIDQRGDAGDLYDQGIAAAREGQFLHDGALANELCARHYLDLGRPFLARAYMTEAHRLYARWGASRAMARLERDFPHALQPEALRRQAALVRSRYAEATGAAMAPAAHDSTRSELDFVTVLRASQAVSGELVLDRLIETLLTIAVEHAGAERGLLIRPCDAEHAIEAEVVTGRDRVEVTLQKAPVTPADLPTAILHYVIRTRENVILDDATAPNLFSDDVYVRERRPRSVLCLALVKQGTLVGVLYLENNLTPRAFTADRIAMLELLASQSAISLENARLYTQLQQENSERKQAEERQKLLLNELNHRVKNTLMIVQAIAGQTLRMADSPRAFTEAFGSRLLALSQTHNLLNETSWKGASLHDVVCAELAPHANGDAGRFSLIGEDVRLRPEAAVTTGMVFHELATNAAKYGALSLPSGHVQVTWSLNAGAAGQWIHLEWLERQGPPVQAPRRKGFGSRLIERDLGRQLAGDVRLEFLPGGVRCVMDLPMDRVAVPG